MTTVYFNDLAISFNNKLVDAFTSSVNIEVTNKTDIVKLVESLHNNGYDYDIYLHGYDIETMFKDFCNEHTFIEAAGGVVKNQKSEYLLIKRLGIWDLPKGKIDKGETTSEAAVREVREETGLKNIEIIGQLPDTFHIYNQKGKWLLKKTYWFFMNTKENTIPIPQIEEDISDAVWMNKVNASKAVSKSYRSIKDGFGYLFV
jgi:ADP-ribose pyrophosphatase YjhB (NUDIX family)